MLAGMSARMLSVTFVSPLELIRTKMQSQKLSYFGKCMKKGPLISSNEWSNSKFHFFIVEVGNALRSLIAYEGVSGLWRGLGPTLCRDVPFSGVYWAVYESIKQHYSVSVPTFGFSFCGGAVAGSVSLINRRRSIIFPNN